MDNLEQIKTIGVLRGAPGGGEDPETLRRRIYYANLKLRDLGCPAFPIQLDPEFADLVGGLMALNREKDRLLAKHLCPVDHRIQNFLYDYLQDAVEVPRLPPQTFVLDRHGLARLLSLPPDRDEFSSDIIHSYRVRQGVLHNPRSDRRTTEGIFHVTEGGLPVPDDKKSVPKAVFGRLLAAALRPPAELLRLPFTSTLPEAAECFVSLLLRPVVSPAVPGVSPEKSMEIRFFAPGGLVCNLDFVESIFGNAGDPNLPENDAALDAEHWTGHTGCVILAPHLNNTLTKEQLGLPKWENATERQKRDGMGWKTADEIYNDGKAFKITARDENGVVVTVISDNYFGYCKKEVKTQIGLAANLFGNAEEEHAGGALIFPSYDLAEQIEVEDLPLPMLRSFDAAMDLLGETVQRHAEGYAVDRAYPDIVYVPENARFQLLAQKVSWDSADRPREIPLRLGHHYVLPCGYKIHMEKPASGRAWRLVGTNAEGTLCHKPCTVSGGGKSEISKPISDAILQGSIFVANFRDDFDRVDELLRHDYADRYADPARRGQDHRLVLSPRRSLGSVIKLLTPSPAFSAPYNAWLETIPQHIKELVFVLKRFYRPEWGEHWRENFSVDTVNGMPANELRFLTRKLVANFLRVGFDAHDSWRTFGLRKDFFPAFKIQMEDDITASTVIPRTRVAALLDAQTEHLPGVKFVHNCEYRLFQRPDDAIHRGYDKLAELDFAHGGNFFSNYQPLSVAEARVILEDAIGYFEYTRPMQKMVAGYVEAGTPAFFVSNANPRLVEGRPTKNPRYLQVRLDLLDPRGRHLSEMGIRLARGLSQEQPVLTPVNAVLAGRRNNPPDRGAGVRSLAVYNPIHHMELPELFMEFICSMTGKSPSTTGAGSEGALTKGPFNALPPIYDLNSAFVSYAVSGYDGFVTAAGYVGPHARVDHDISLLVPEVWCRMSVEERSPEFLRNHGYLEPLEDFEHEGRTILAARLGSRITKKFANTFFGRVFNHPHVVLTDEMLRPELQGVHLFVEGMDNIIVTQKRVAAHYFNDGSIAWACPPLHALLHIMRDDHYEGKSLADQEVRAMFTRESVLASDWYRARLEAKQRVDERLWNRHAAYLEKFLKNPNYAAEADRLGVGQRLASALARLKEVRDASYVDSLLGTIGAEP
ncbi:MAG: hypothetical protein JHC52_07135, partial [Chthoniobacterales bacterium]|nr:hypothetical protein [Chthoniobacterales bacterium]